MQHQREIKTNKKSNSFPDALDINNKKHEEKIFLSICLVQLGVSCYIIGKTFMKLVRIYERFNHYQRCQGK